MWTQNNVISVQFLKTTDFNIFGIAVVIVIVSLNGNSLFRCHRLRSHRFIHCVHGDKEQNSAKSIESGIKDGDTFAVSDILRDRIDEDG